MALTKIQTEQIADDAVGSAHIADNIALGGSPTTTTQSASDNSTKVATTAYVDAAYTALVDSSPATLNTLNELAAALGDDANFSTTVTNSIATKLPLAGGTMTGNLIVNAIVDADNFKINNAQGSDGQVLTSTGSGVAWETPSSFNADAAQTFNDSGAAVDFRIESDDDANMFFVDGSEDKIGIGTSSPAKPLHISSADNQPLRVESTDAYSGIELKDNGSSTLPPLISALSDDLLVYTGHASTRVNVAKFDNDGKTYLKEIAGLDASLEIGNGDEKQIFDGSGQTIQFQVADEEKMRLNTTGPVLTVSDAGSDGYETLLKLERTHNSCNEVGIQLDLTGSGGTAQAVGIYAAKTEDWTSGTSRSATLNFQVKDDGTDQLMYAFGNFSDGVNEHKFYTEGAERMRILQGGGITFNGDTAAANALDDYEEGEWSPNLIGTTGSAGTYARSANPNAHYTKVGRLVTIQCSFYITNKGSYTGKTRLTGLPYAAATSTSQLALGSFPDSGYGTASGNVLIAAAVDDQQNYIGFFDGSRLDPRHDYADVGTGYYINISGTYMAAT